MMPLPRRALPILLSPLPARAQRAPATVPDSWRRFAATLQARLEPVIAGDAATSVRAALAARGPAGLVVQVWVDDTGRPTRLEAPTAEPALLAELRAALLGGSPGEAPPPDLAQPITLRLVVAPG